MLHDMQNRNIHLGYLVVFEARQRDFGKKLLSRSADGFTESRAVVVST
jgi:hypothetical protein